jgi:hypothetical protein
MFPLAFCLTWPPLGMKNIQTQSHLCHVTQGSQGSHTKVCFACVLHAFCMRFACVFACILCAFLRAFCVRFACVLRAALRLFLRTFLHAFLRAYFVHFCMRFCVHFCVQLCVKLRICKCTLRLYVMGQSDVLKVNKKPTLSLTHRDRSIHTYRERGNMRLQGIACTRSFGMDLASAEDQKLECFK